MRKAKLKLSVLKPATRKIFSVLAEIPGASAFTLIGGTALSLQIGHRVSNDFDFAVFSGRLPTTIIENIVGTLKEQGHSVNLITDISQISAFRINEGESLLNFVRDYTVDNVKVTFFANFNKQEKVFYQKTLSLAFRNVSFRILGLDGLKTAKILVLANRVKSRDLFDLMILMRDYNFSIAEAFAIVQSLGTNNDPEYYKAVMTGKIPLDAEDEGLTPVGVKTSLDEIYDFFERAIEQYEIFLAADLWRKSVSEK